MRLKTIKSVLERIWQVLIFVRKDRTGTGKFGAFLPDSKDAKKPAKIRQNSIERNVVINGTHIHVKSVFGDIPLEKALANIAKRKLAVSEKNGSHN